MSFSHRSAGTSQRPLHYPEVDTMVKVLSLLHPGANAEWLFTNDKGEPPAPLGLHIGDTAGELDITIETSQGAEWVGTINAWRLPKAPYMVPCAATVAALAMQIATAAASELQSMAAQAAFFITAM